MERFFDPIDREIDELMKVITQITKKSVPLISERDLITNKNIRNLNEWANEYSFTDGDLVADLKSAVNEFKYLLVVIKDLRERLKERDSEVQRLERLQHNG